MTKEKSETIAQIKNDFLKLSNGNVYCTNDRKRVLELSKGMLKAIYKVDEIVIRS